MAEICVGEILEAENGLAALKIMDTHHVDFVLADLNMPEMNGIEMIHRMKSDKATQDIPVAIISAESSATRIGELLSTGVKDYLHKPFTPEEFRNIIKNSLEHADEQNR
jgi:two-component system chemotaxis response regulator CheY